ncbi:sulfurtransferase TusA family protein [Microbulbifer hydrolyticus]|uniref:Sulfurtransferase TusA family protein n=1 Tax=Microbulbifer hydrolyticus TaxID=48074 RepID=A0A6P1T9P8_9GAMM|nr:sulfurtransferase TusA family protein [Microbulbifer hydrolyticus]MBB5212821.1 tRNA 2-thiouridine synthesizing protein A [Microbulbifer hydrolyticus]QHQ38383.1 sulfurtransferase TusA family protein [Microbulbifer hydrolyticus]
MTDSPICATDRPGVDWESAYRVDARGLPCPQPLLAMRRAMKQLAPGALLHLVATDPASERDIRSFCTLSGVPLLRVETQGKEFHYWLQPVVAGNGKSII